MQQISFWKRIRLLSAQHNMGWKRTVLLGLALLGTLLTMGGTFVYAQHTPLRILAIDTTIIQAYTDCSYTASDGWTCPLTLSRSDRSTASLDWSFLSTAGILVTPATGTLVPGGTITVSIAVANRVCPSSSTMSFEGPNNTVKVHWSCSAAQLTLFPTHFVANSQCPATSGGWQCPAEVIEAPASQGNLNWSTKSYLSGVTFTPASGVLSPGGSTPVSIFVPQGTKCASGNLRFAGQGSNTIVARWMCKAGPPKVTIDEFPLPTPDTRFNSIAAGPDGTLWFTDNNGCIGRISPTGAVTLFPLPPNSEPYKITAGPDGNLWFTEYHSIGRITPAGSITEFTLPNSSDLPSSITSGPDGNLWFTDENENGNSIGRISPTGTVTEFPLSPSNSALDSITTGPDGNLWFTDVNRVNASSIGRISPTGTVTEFPLSPSSVLDGLTAGPDGNLWFTDVNSNKIGRITPTGAITAFPLPPNSELEGITAGLDGNLWFTDYYSSSIGRISPTGTVTLFPLPTPNTNSQPYRITTGPDGTLWFTEPQDNKIGRVTLP